MRLYLLPLLVILSLGRFASQAMAQSAAAQAGEALAQRDCAVCHIVAARQETRPLVPKYAPSFFDVANTPEVTAASLESFHADHHPMSNMPYPGLTAAQIREVAGYIVSLRARR